MPLSIYKSTTQCGSVKSSLNFTGEGVNKNSIYLQFLQTPDKFSRVDLFISSSKLDSWRDSQENFMIQDFDVVKRINNLVLWLYLSGRYFSCVYWNNYSFMFVYRPSQQSPCSVWHINILCYKNTSSDNKNNDCSRNFVPVKASLPFLKWLVQILFFLFCELFRKGRLFFLICDVFIHTYYQSCNIFQRCSYMAAQK